MYEDDKSFATYGNDAAYAVLPHTGDGDGDSADAGGNNTYGGDAAYDDLQQPGAVSNDIGNPKSKAKRGDDSGRIYRNEGYAEMPGADDVVDLRSTGCNRKAPSGRYCTIPLLDGMFYCKKHQCPQAGCREGKGSKEDGCTAHIDGGGGGGGDINVYSEFPTATPTAMNNSISNPSYEKKAPPGQEEEAMPYMDTSNTAGEMYLPPTDGDDL